MGKGPQIIKYPRWESLISRPEAGVVLGILVP